jgi:hypothetical protein
MFEIDRCGLYELVPADINLLEASPADLDRYGIPQKPDVVTEPELFRQGSRRSAASIHRPSEGRFNRC